jgi:hypothetical protein
MINNGRNNYGSDNDGDNDVDYDGNNNYCKNNNNNVKRIKGRISMYNVFLM